MVGKEKWIRDQIVVALDVVLEKDREGVARIAKGTTGRT